MRFTWVLTDYRIKSLFRPIFLIFDFNVIEFSSGYISFTISMHESCDVINDVKLFPTIYHRIYCRYPIKKRVVDSNFVFLTMFQQLTTGSDWLRAYQPDYVIANYVEPAVI